MFLQYARKLDFYDQPNYDYLVGLFEKVLNSQDKTDDCEFDWIFHKNFKLRRFGENDFPRPAFESQNHIKSYNLHNGNVLTQKYKSNDNNYARQNTQNQNNFRKKNRKKLLLCCHK